MTCSSCEAKVKSALLTVENVTNVEVSKDENSATITMDKHIALQDFQKALNQKDRKYQILAINHNDTAQQARNWLETYKPILLIFAYITGVTLLIQQKMKHLTLWKQCGILWQVSFWCFHFLNY